MAIEQEHTFACPYCWQTISVLVDLSDPNQDMIQDCEVCCRPMRILCSVVEGEIDSFDVTAP